MKRLNKANQAGFTLTELMVVVAIMAILASVAVPAYINYVNRSKQSEAAGQLMTARLEMEEFLTDNQRYAQTIQCLPTFASTRKCLENCSDAACLNTQKLKYYTFRVVTANSSYYQIAATRQIYPASSADNILISASTDTPLVTNTNALKFSVFQWLFE